MKNNSMSPQKTYTIFFHTNMNAGSSRSSKWLKSSSRVDGSLNRNNINRLAERALPRDDETYSRATYNSTGKSKSKNALVEPERDEILYIFQERYVL